MTKETFELDNVRYGNQKETIGTDRVVLATIYYLQGDIGSQGLRPE